MTYNFSLASGAYLSTYDHAAGPNTETSTVVHAQLLAPLHRPLAGERAEASCARPATGADILDRNENQFTPDDCGRSRLTFARGRGRLPRQPQRPRPRDPRVPRREQRADDRAPADLLRRAARRTRPSSGCTGSPAVMSFLDYSAAATGMTYRNNNNLGRRDDRRRGRLGGGRARSRGRAWTARRERSRASTPGARRVAAEQVHLVLPRPREPARRADPCQGDGGFYGASGPYVNGSIDSTDEPANGTAPADRLTSTRTLFFDAPGAANGALRRQQVTARLTTNVDPPPAVPLRRWSRPRVVGPPRDTTRTAGRPSRPSSCRCACAIAARRGCRAARRGAHAGGHRSRPGAACRPRLPLEEGWPPTARGRSG